MKLIIYKNKNLINTAFANYLIKTIKKNVMLSLELNKWQIVVNYLNKYTNISNGVELLNKILSNLEYLNYMDRYVFQFSVNKKIGNYTVDQIIKIINDGNTEFKGYPIILKVFKEIKDNIDKYYRLFTLFGGVV